MTSSAIEKVPAHHEQSALTQFEAMREQAAALVQSGFLPRAVNTPEKALAIMQTGKELGLGPMQALRSIHIIEGKPTMSADLIAGLALARVPGAHLRVTETTNLVCRIEAARQGQEPTKFSFSIEDAKAAGLTGKDNWRKYPRAMLRARCLTEACRAMFPDAVAGIFDPDELTPVSLPPVHISEVLREHSEDLHLSAHTPIDESPDAGQSEDAGAFVTRVTAELEKLKSDCAYCKTWDELVRLREVCGTKAKQSRLTREMQDYGPERRIISGAQYKELSKLWMHCDRQLTALEAKLKPPPVEASFVDEPDGTEALGAPEREPGEEG